MKNDELTNEIEIINTKLQDKINKFCDIKFVRNELKNLIESSQVKVINFWINDINRGNYTSGTNCISDINNFNDKSMNKGFTTFEYGFIIFEFDCEVEFECIEIGVFQGHDCWRHNNLNNAEVETSKDNINWQNVGILKITNYEINKIHLKRSTAKFIKIDHSNSKRYLGIGYFKVNT